MTELLDTLRTIPLAGLIPVTLLAIVGVLLWAAGRKVLRAGFAAGGFLLGALAGWALGEQLQFGIPPWTIGIGLGLLLACVAALTYRLAVAASLALVLAVAAPLAVITVHEFQGREILLPPTEAEPQDDSDAANAPEDALWPELTEDAESAPDEFDRWLNPERFVDEQIKSRLPGLLREETEAAAAEQGLVLSPEMSDQLDQVASHARSITDTVLETWRRTPESLRPVLLFAAAMGGLLGMLVGALTPTLSAAVVTSFGGSLLWLAAARVIIERVGLGDSSFLPETGRVMLAVWIVMAVIGLAIQWTFRPRPADKPGSAPSR